MNELKLHQLRLIISISFFIFFSLLEFIYSRRNRSIPRVKRWPTNLGIILINSVLVTLLGITPYFFALKIEKLNIGIFNQFHIGLILKTILTIVVMDLLIYAQHVFFHKIPIFWNLHKIHHTDLDLDVSSGFRFHPLEILISLFIKYTAIAFIGASPVGVLLFEIILNSCALFNHSNIRIKGKLDSFIKILFVTPDMHRIHHSVEVKETNSNFGFNFTIWDRLFKTYKSVSRLPQTTFPIGLPDYQTKEPLNLLQILKLPFVKKKI